MIGGHVGTFTKIMLKSYMYVENKKSIRESKAKNINSKDFLSLYDK